MKFDPAEFVLLRTAAKLLGVSKHTVWRWVTMDGRLEGIRVGHRWFVKETDLINMVNRDV